MKNRVRWTRSGWGATESDIEPVFDARGKRDKEADARNNAAFVKLWEFIKRRDYAGGLRFLESLKPDEVDAYWREYHIGKVHGFREDYAAALEHLTAAAAMEPQDPQVHHALGVAYQGAGRNDEAVQAHTRAIELRQDYVEAWMSLGLTLLVAGEPLNAEKAFRSAMLALGREAMRAVGAGLPPGPELLGDYGTAAAAGPGQMRVTEEAAALLRAEGRFAMIGFHAGMALVAADHHAAAKSAIEEALAMGLAGEEAERAREWLQKYAAGDVSRRLN